MANLYSQATYDNALLLRAPVAAIIGTETGSLILDIGTGLVDADLILDIVTAKVSANDESYTFVLEGSPDATFGTAANIMPMSVTAVCAAGSTIGVLNAQGTSDTVGRFLVPVRNERNGTTYRYLRLKTVITGTNPSTTFTAFLAKDQD